MNDQTCVLSGKAARGGRDGREVAVEVGALGAAGKERGGGRGIEVREVAGGVAGDEENVVMGVADVIGPGGMVHLGAETTSSVDRFPRGST